MTNLPRPDLLQAQEGMADFVAMYTGLRQQFIDAGWTIDGAEAMTIELWRKGTV